MNHIKLSNGIDIPQLVIGTNWMEKDELRNILEHAFNAGFRSIDTARDYGNEAVVGQALKEALHNVGLDRSEIFITTKIGNSQQVQGDIKKELEISLNNLQIDYIDLWLMHWPYPSYYIRTWDKMQDLYLNTGKIKAIGVANYDIRHFEKLKSSSPEIMPMVNQIECHPLRTVINVRNYMEKESIQLEAYAPLCRLAKPLVESTILNELSHKYKKSIGQVILRWHIQNKSVAIFKSYNPKRFKENIDIFDFELTQNEIESINSLNQGYKYHLESASCPGY